MKNIFLSSFLMMSTFLYSQTGIVVDSDGQPINQASVFLADQKILFYTNDKGEFFLDNELSNSNTIHVYKFGYSSELVNYKKDMELKFVLNKLHVSLDEVGVSTSVNELGNSKLINIEKKSLKDNFLNYSSMLENITKLSGVDMISSGTGIQKVVVRGLSGMRVVTFLNGMKINNQQWANDHGIGFTDLGLDEVELIKGSSALKFGSEAIGGVLYFKDDPFISSEKLSGFVSTKYDNSSQLSNSQFGIKFNQSNLFLNFYAQYAISSDYRLPNNRYLFNSRYSQNAFKLSIAHKGKRMQNIFRYHLHNEIVGLAAHSHGDISQIDITDISSESLDFEDFQIERPNQFVTNQLFIHDLTYFINDIKFSLHTGHYINHLEEWDKWTLPAFDLTINHTQVTPNLRYKLNSYTFDLGAQISFIDNKNNVSYRLIPDANSIDFGPYLIFDYEKNNFGFNSGVRFDYKNLQSIDPSLVEDYNESFSNISFSNGVYTEFSNHILRLTYSGAYRAPHIAELFSYGLHHGTNRFEIGDRDLKIESGHQFDLKYQWSNDHFGFVINPFIHFIKDFISVLPTDTFSEGFQVYYYTQFDNVELTGIEMNLHYHPHILHNLHIEQSYSFLQSKNEGSDDGLALLPADNINTKIIFHLNDYERLQKLKLNYLTIDHKYVFEQDTHAEYEDFTSDYNVFNLLVGLKFTKKIHCVLGVMNLLNAEYSPHTSRLRGVGQNGVPNPGRSFNINMKYEF